MNLLRFFIPLIISVGGGTIVLLYVRYFLNKAEDYAMKFMEKEKQ